MKKQILPAHLCRTFGAALLLLISTSSWAQTALEVNHVRTLSPREEMEEITDRSPSKVRTSTEYLDGLGRPVQGVLRAGSPDRKDIVQISAYDRYGRQSLDYLPYKAPEGTGGFRTGALMEQRDHYQNAQHTPHDSHPWARKVFEPHPLGRVSEQGATGTVWQPDGTDSARTEKFRYRTNFAKDSVRLWRLSGGRPISYKIYGNGELRTSIITDEEGKETQTFTDKQDRLVLQKDRISPTAYAETHYVYDEWGRLVFILPPQLLQKLSASGAYAPSQGLLDRYAFRYVHDRYGRKVLEKKPGAAPEYFIYDARDRLVLQQDGGMRSTGRWHFTKYDARGRAVMTGLYRNQQVSGREAMQQYLYRFYQGVTIQHERYYEERSMGTGSVLGYTNRSFPDLSDEAPYLTVSYYDDYAFPHAKDQRFVAETGYARRIGRARGQVTGTKIRLLGGDRRWLNTTHYYDEHYRALQTVADDHLGGMLRSSTRYSFTGLTMETIDRYRGSHRMNVRHYYVYDHADRPLIVKQRIDDAPWVTLIKNRYNATGQLVEQGLHSLDGGATSSQSVDYSYNIRGWLTAINDPSLKSGPGNWDLGQAKDLFGMRLSYEEPGPGLGQPRYDGSASVMEWSAVDGQHRAYAYAYDALGRLRAAKGHVRKEGWRQDAAHSVSGISHDLNGNLLSLRRNTAQGQPLDLLTYTYEGNRLRSVHDAGYKKEGFKDGVREAREYDYDAAGRLIRDRNRGITAIDYNPLGLPRKIDKGREGSLRYTYGADGTKYVRELISAQGRILQRTDYTGALVLVDGNPLTLAHAAGRALYRGGTWEYLYDLTDHQGSVRLTFTGSPDTLLYRATMEYSRAEEEERWFTNLAATRARHPAADATGTVARLDGNQPIGPSIGLKVAPGDSLHLQVQAWPGPGSSAHRPARKVLAAALASALAAPSGAGPEGALARSPVGPVALALAALGKRTDEDDRGGSLNYLLFDRDMALMDAGFVPVRGENAQGMEKLALSLPRVQEEGYLYVYLAHGSRGGHTYFDDLTVSFIQGRTVQRDDYYPYGMVSSSRHPASGPVNPYLYHGKEREDSLGLGLYDYGARYYDPALARWQSVDPLAGHPDQVAKSPYGAFWNNPVLYDDPDGRYPSSYSPELPKLPDWVVNPDPVYDGGVLPEITVYASGSFDSDYQEYAFSGTFSQWQAKYGHPGLPYDMEVELYDAFHREEFFREWEASVKYEQGQRTVAKMKRFIEGYTTAGTFGMGVLGSGFMATPKQFSYNIRYNQIRYHPRLDAQVNTYHNFPASFDKHIIKNGAPSQRLSDGARWFEMEGSINGVRGNYQIGISNGNRIFHRNFVPIK